MKTETLQDSLDTYRSKIGDNSRNLAAAYELALKAERPYLPGDQISYYVTGRRGDRERERTGENGGGLRSAAIPTRTSSTTSSSSPTSTKNSAIFVESPGLFVPVVETDENPAQLSLFGSPPAKPEEPIVEPEV